MIETGLSSVLTKMSADADVSIGSTIQILHSLFQSFINNVTTATICDLFIALSADFEMKDGSHYESKILNSNYIMGQP